MHDRSRIPKWLQVGRSRNAGLILALLVALGILAVANPNYLRWDNFLVVALQMSFIGIGALGTAHLIISGNVDLSIGSNYALCAVVAALLAKIAPAAEAMMAGVALGGVIGWLNGLLVWRVKISPIIITLGTLAIVRGLALLVTGGYGVRNVPHQFGALGQGRPLGIPSSIWALAILTVISYIILHKTTIGRYLFAIGGNIESSATAGIRVRRMVLATFTVNGIVIGIAAVLAASRFGSATPYFGQGFEIDVITAVSLGGVAFKGGEGDIPGVILAVLLLGVVNSGLVSLGIDPHYTQIVKGGALLAAVLVDQLTQERQEAHRKRMAQRERREAAA